VVEDDAAQGVAKAIVITERPGTIVRRRERNILR